MKKSIYIELLRIIACLFVIINHTHGFMLTNSYLSTIAFYSLIFSMCKTGVPIFLMITGSLILDKEYDLKKVFTCIYKIFVPLFILSLIFYIKDNYLNINLYSFICSFIKTPYIEPFWYLYGLIGLYFVIPFIQKMIKNFNNKDYIYFIFISLLIPSFISMICLLLNTNISLSFYAAEIPMFIGMCILGNYISKIDLNKKYFIISNIMFIIGLIIMMSSMLIPYFNTNEISHILDSWNSFPVIIMSISLFYNIRYLEKYFIGIGNYIITIGSTTFGIYLIHTVFNDRLYHISFINNIFSFNVIIGIIILELLVFITCFIIIYLLKKIPIINKFI